MTSLRSCRFPRQAARAARLLSLVLTLSATHVFAQACCAGGSALTPGRLSLHEDAAVGLSLRATDITGSFDGARHFINASSGTVEADFEEDVLGTVRFLERGQVTLLVPVVETLRQVPGFVEAEFGGGIGDLNLSARYDFFGAGESATIPGFAVLVGVTAPTGRIPEHARQPLATDATGIGAVQLTAGLALEQTFGHILVNVTGLLSQRLPRNVEGVSETLGLQFQGLAAVGYAFANDAALALAFNYTAEGDARLAGQTAPGTGRALSVLGISGGLPLGEVWRLQGGVFLDLPFEGSGRNQPVGPGFNITLLRTWT